ncbi:MAG: fructokinase, partial [Gammaproteobacteria bacterium]
MRLGIDLGGTKIEVLVLSDTGKELFRERVAT